MTNTNTECATDETKIKQPEKYRVIFYKKLKWRVGNW